MKPIFDISGCTTTEPVQVYLPTLPKSKSVSALYSSFIYVWSGASFSEGAPFFVSIYIQSRNSNTKLKSFPWLSQNFMYWLQVRRSPLYWLFVVSCYISAWLVCLAMLLPRLMMKMIQTLLLSRINIVVLRATTIGYCDPALFLQQPVFLCISSLKK